jgi:hypothetical protein
MFASQRRNHRSPIAARDFCNKIGTTRNNDRTRTMSGSALKAAMLKLPRQVREVP